MTMELKNQIVEEETEKAKMITDGSSSSDSGNRLRELMKTKRRT